MAELEEQAYKLAGRPFNLGSPKQLGEVLFKEQGLAASRKTRTGEHTTAAQVLETLAAEGHPLPRTILDWRQLQKLTGTYTDALIQEIGPDGRVHTSYAMAATSTGRLSSNDPNLQNIPIRTEEGRKIRRAFVAEAGQLLLSADYSQIELRVLAHMAGIEALKEAFARDTDVHAVTASQMFGVPVAGIDPLLRRNAKMINYGIIYGIGAFGLAQRLGIEYDVARRYIEAYFEQYPGIRDYMERAKEEARAQGYVDDAVRPAVRHARDQERQPGPARLCRAGGDQRADPGLRGRHHAARDDPRRPRAVPLEPRRADAAAGARRAGVRGAGGRGRADRRADPRGDGAGGPSRRAAGGRRRPRRELGRRALTTPALAALAERILAGDRRALARAITLIELRRLEHQLQAEQLLGRLLPATGKAVRLGISGTPGAGKSTLIEALGAHLIEQGHQVAVLAVDPSSRRSGGSILGDKTRMQRLAQAPAGVHPALARGRHARRRHPAHPRGGARLRGGRVRRGGDRDRRGRPERERGRRHGRQLSARCSRPAAATSCRASSAASSSWPTWW